jgi:hypothetical protein
MGCQGSGFWYSHEWHPDGRLAVPCSPNITLSRLAENGFNNTLEAGTHEALQRLNNYIKVCLVCLTIRNQSESLSSNAFPCHHIQGRCNAQIIYQLDYMRSYSVYVTVTTKGYRRETIDGTFTFTRYRQLPIP